MLETPHVTVGAAIAAKIPNPLIAIPLAFASHFFLEKVPHWNPHLNTELKTYGQITKKSRVVVVVDVAISLAIGFFIAFNRSQSTSHFLTIIACCLASALPDIIEGPYFFFKVRGKLIEKWIAFQKSLQSDTNIYLGLSTQLITVLAALYWVFI